MHHIQNQLKKELDAKVIFYNQSNFIKDDPVCIPHLFSKNIIKNLYNYYK